MVFGYCGVALALAPQEALEIDRIIDSSAHWMPREQLDVIRGFGPDVIPHILDRYSASDNKGKAKLAALLWSINWKSEEAARVLLQDAKTQDRTLRVNIQYALGHLSDNPLVVQTLLDNMRNDPNPFLRDKAACALAHNQVNLDMQQKYYLYRGLIEGLGDEKAQVRHISIKALKIHTGQTMGFSASDDPQVRNAAIIGWRKWLEDYQRNL